MNEHKNYPGKEAMKEVINLIIVMLLITAGCGGPRESGSAEKFAFANAGIKLVPSAASRRLDANGIISYTVAVGDVIEIQMPVIMKDIIALPHENEPYLCRVNESGNIPLPVVGAVNVIGKTLTQTEQAIAAAYYPKYVLTEPSVVCKVREHIETRAFTVTGLVNKPGIFDYPTNVEYSLVDAIANAGGINLSANPKFAKVYRRSPGGNIVSATFKIDKASTDKATKVIIRPGDIVALEPTFETQTNTFISQVFRFNVGAYVDQRAF